MSCWGAGEQGRPDRQTPTAPFPIPTSTSAGEPTPSWTTRSLVTTPSPPPIPEPLEHRRLPSRLPAARNRALSHGCCSAEHPANKQTAHCNKLDNDVLHELFSPGASLQRRSIPSTVPPPESRPGQTTSDLPVPSANAPATPPATSLTRHPPSTIHARPGTCCWPPAPRGPALPSEHGITRLHCFNSDSFWQNFQPVSPLASLASDGRQHRKGPSGPSLVFIFPPSMLALLTDGRFCTGWPLESGSSNDHQIVPAAPRQLGNARSARHRPGCAPTPGNPDMDGLTRPSKQCHDACHPKQACGGREAKEACEACHGVACPS